MGAEGLVEWVDLLPGLSSSGAGIGATVLGLKPLAWDWFPKAGNVLEKALPGTSEPSSPSPAAQLLLFRRSMGISLGWRHHHRTENSAVH